jgi:hypothetical protein
MKKELRGNLRANKSETMKQTALPKEFIFISLLLCVNIT